MTQNSTIRFLFQVLIITLVALGMLAAEIDDVREELNQCKQELEALNDTE